MKRARRRVGRSMLLQDWVGWGGGVGGGGGVGRGREVILGPKKMHLDEHLGRSGEIGGAWVCGEGGG